MNVLVTGGSGFIGSYVVERLLYLGHKVTVMDHHEKHTHPDVDLFLGDVRDYTAVSEAVGHHDGVIHLAGVLGTAETVDEPTPSVETNILGSLNVFKACRHYKRRAVYIAVGNHWMNNSYSISKTTAERFALMFNKEHGTEIAVVRAFNAYGPGQREAPVRKIVPNFVLPCLRGGQILVYGDGEQVMDMVYVADVADILCRALLLDHGVYDRVFEGGCGRVTTVNEIAAAVIDAVGSGSVRHMPMRAGEEPGSKVLADVTTLEALGKFRFTPLEAGLVPTVKFYRELEGI